MADDATSNTETTAAETSDGRAQATATEATTTETTSATDNTSKVSGEQALGDAGKKALDAMKAERNTARDELKALRAEFDALKAKADGKEAEHAAAQEAQRIRDEALATANQRILKAELRAAAKGKVADEAIADLPALMDLSGLEVGTDGEVDASQIAQAIDSLIESKPYLAAQGGQRFQGGADGGTRNGGTQPAQLTRADVERLAAEGKHAEIDKAREEGRLNDVLGIKTT